MQKRQAPTENHYQEAKQDVRKNAVGNGLAINDLTSFRAPVHMVAAVSRFRSLVTRCWSLLWSRDIHAITVTCNIHG